MISIVVIRTIRGKVLFILNSVYSILSNSTRVVILSIIIKYIVRASIIICVLPIPIRQYKFIPLLILD